MYPSNNSNNRNGMHGKRKQLLMKMRTSNKLYGESDSLGNQTRGHKTTNTKASRFLWTTKESKEPPRYLFNKDLFFLKNGNTEEKKYILSLHKIHAQLFPEANLEEKMNRWVHKEFKNFNEDARLSIQHWKDSWHKRVYKQNQRKFRDNPEYYFSNHKIKKVVKITTDQLCGLDFMEQIIVMRENDKPDSFSEADFKYLNRNDIEDVWCNLRESS
ncbi:hypothetical protein Tco_1545429 [Tanacetum coccineum]